MRTFFNQPLDNAVTFWRIYRRDGVTLGLVSHDRSLRFGGIDHYSAPGMTPAAIRLTDGLEDDEAEVEGALSHAAISEADLAAGKYDEATIELGVVDWEALEHHIIYSGQLGNLSNTDNSFVAELRSAKMVLREDRVPRTSPTCRAEFCGPGCDLSTTRFTADFNVSGVDLDANMIWFDGLTADNFKHGLLRFCEGPQTGLVFGILDVQSGGLVLDRALYGDISIGTRARLIEGCDHTLATCANRFGNAINFRGEPFLPGNDLLARYGTAS
jgi:uncharacterized phage protein (TIGR02218 family)